MPETLPSVSSLSLEEYNQLAEEGYNRIPFMREVLADLDTPLSTYRKLADEPWTYLFESVQGGEKWGRYSIIGLGCEEILTVHGFDLEVKRAGKSLRKETVDNPLDAVEEYRAANRVPELPGLPRFNGGLVGYFGYETVGYIETKLQPVLAKPDAIGVPDILLMLSCDIVVFDNLRGSLMVITHVVPGGDPEKEYSSAQQRLDGIVQRLREPGPAIDDRPSGRKVSEEDFVSSFPEPEFHKAVDEIKEYVLAGDIMQVVISQRMSVDYKESPLDLYRALRYLNPSPYMYYLNLGDFFIVGSSPEILVRNEHDEGRRKVSVRPIAGTRRRGHTEAEDLEMEKELLADPKEIAEHLMLIDLGRNDVGRVAKTSTVEVTDQMIVERYSHVMHIVSNVEAELREGMSSMDVLKATFPAGTLSGAPKIRAMEIINELEPVKRGVYGGAVGYISWHDDMDTAIAIRTAVIRDGRLHVQAGAGVVADSVPRLEWKETMNKGRALFTAVAMVQSGLKPGED